MRFEKEQRLVKVEILSIGSVNFFPEARKVWSLL